MPRINKPTNAQVTSIGEQLGDDVEIDGVNDLPPASDDLGDTADLFNDVERVCAEVGSTTDAATINIFRVDELRKKADAFLMSTTPKEFSLERILFEYGGGSYRIRGYHPREYGGVKFFINRIVVLEEPKRRIDAPAVSGPNLDAVITAINEMNRQNREAILSIVTSQKPTESRSDFLKELLVMKELFATHSEPSPQNPLAMLKDLLEMQTSMKALSGDGGDGNSMMSVLGLKLMDKLGDLAAMHKASPPVLTAPTLNVPDAVSDEEKQMKQMLDAIIAAATAKADVGFWADAVYDQAPDDVLDDLLLNPKWFDKFSKLDARLPPLASWFAQLGDRVREINKAQLTVAPADDTTDEISDSDTHVS